MELPSLAVSVMGSPRVGKSCLVICYVTGKYMDDYESRDDETFSKQVDIDGERLVLDILDTFAETDQDFPFTPDHWISQRSAFILCYSITNKQSLEHLSHFTHSIAGFFNESDPIALMLVGTKLDLDHQRQVSSYDTSRVVSDLRSRFAMVNLMEVSSQKNMNVEDCFAQLVRDYRRVRRMSVSKRGPSQSNGTCEECCVLL